MDETGINPGAIHALWTLQGLGVISNDTAGTTAPSILNNKEVVAAISAGLKHPSAGVRRAAIQVLPAGPAAIVELNKANLIADIDPQVQLAFLLSLSEQPSSTLAGEWIGMLSQKKEVGGDHWLNEALTCAAAAHTKEFFAALAKTSPESRESNANRQKILAICAEHLARSNTADREVIESLNYLVKFKPSDAEAAIDGLYRGWPKTRTLQLQAETQNGLVSLLDKFSFAGRAHLVRLGMTFGNEELQKRAADLLVYWKTRLGDSKMNAKQRIQTAEELIGFAPNEETSVEAVLALITPKTSADLTLGLMATLEATTAKNLGPELVRITKDLPPSQKEISLRTILQRPVTISALLDAIEARELSWNDLNIVQQQSLLRHIDKTIQERAKKIVAAGGGLPNPDREKVIENYLASAQKSGDVVKGKALFTTHCSRCHRYQGDGAVIGPDLTGMAIHPKRELLTNILDPNRSVEANFRQYNVLTLEGRSFTGLLTAESRTSIDVIDIDGKRRAINRDDIESISALTQSIMPEGFEKQLSLEQMSDLLSFLTQRSKYVPLSITKYATSNTTQGMFLSETHDIETLVFEDWGPKNVGKVPFQLIDPQGTRKKNAIMLYGPQGKFPPTMPKSVTIPCNGSIKSVHFLSGVSGWGHPYSQNKSTTIVVRFHFEDNTTEDHKLLNGVHFADYISRVDVPESKFAFDLKGRQLRYLSIPVESKATMTSVELIKGEDATAPVIMGITIESR